MSTAGSSISSPTSLLSPHSAVSYTPYTSNNAQQQQHRPPSLSSGWPSRVLPLPSSALAAEADAPLNLGLDEEEVVWGGESVGLGFGLLSRLKDKTNALLEAIDWDCRLCGKTATDPCVTRCGHLFCWSHLTKHLAKVPLCPKCTSPLAMDRDVVQVFGRPKAIPSDAPWTSVNHTPGEVTRNERSERSDGESASPSPAYDLGESNTNSVPPPSTSPEDLRSRSTSSLDSNPNIVSPSLYPKNQQRRRGIQPLTSIHPVRRSSSYDSDSLDDNRFGPGGLPNVFVTTVDSDQSRSSSRGGVSESAKEEKEEDSWAAWRRRASGSGGGSDAATAMPSSNQTRRPSALSLGLTGRKGRDSSLNGGGKGENNLNLRAPSPIRLHTKPFRPGWASSSSSAGVRRTATEASADSFDTHVRQSIEVKFTRGSQFTDGGRRRQEVAHEEEGEAESEEDDGNVIYLHSPSFKKAALAGASSSGGLGLELDLQPKILSPVPKYAYAQDDAAELEQAVSSPVSPIAATPLKGGTSMDSEDFRATGRKWFAEHRRRTAAAGNVDVVVTPTTTTFRPADVQSTRDFVNLKVAMKDAAQVVGVKVEGEEEEEKKKGGVLADPLGRALCVFAVVLLVKILLK